MSPGEEPLMEGGSDDLVGRVVAGRYRVLSLLGSGAMGSVFLAEHTRMGRRDALKILARKLADDRDALARFTREARNASFISHPNVCEIYDFGETADGLPFIAMQFVDGETLGDTIERGGALAPARVVDIGAQITRALEVAHARGIVHRDLKPQNVMLTRSIDGSELVKVVDFGIAKAMTSEDEGQEVTRAGWVVGTPEYVSPEQLGGQRVDGRSDIYSLGILLFKSLTGVLPFAGSTWQEVMTARLTEAPRRLADLRPDLADYPQLQKVIDAALARDPDDRPATVAELREGLLASLQAPSARSAPPVDSAGGRPGSGGGRAGRSEGAVASGTPGARGQLDRPHAGSPEGAEGAVPPTVAAQAPMRPGAGAAGPAPVSGDGGARRVRWIGAAMGVLVLGVGGMVVASLWSIPEGPGADAGTADGTELVAEDPGDREAAGGEREGEATDGSGASERGGSAAASATDPEGGGGTETGPDVTPAGRSGDEVDEQPTGPRDTATPGAEAPSWSPAVAEDLLFRQLTALGEDGVGQARLTAARDSAVMVWEAPDMPVDQRAMAAYVAANALQELDRPSDALMWADRAVELAPQNRAYRSHRDMLAGGGP